MRNVLHKDNYYTYADYANWDVDARYELIKGAPYMMAPAPSDGHQSISGNLYLQLGNFLKGKPCKVRSAPYDVRLNADTDDDTVVQPDIVVICDSSKISSKGCVGVPDMVIEILSHSTARHDRFVKFQLYQQAGVREYWIVDPDTRTVQACILKNGEYVAKVYADTDTAPVYVLEDCRIELKDVFSEPAYL